MFDVFIRTHFSAAHYLRNYPGNCEHLHGHNWNVEVVVRAEKLRLAEYIYRRVKEDLKPFNEINLARVTVCETSKTGVTYWEDLDPERQSYSETILNSKF